MAMPEIRLIDIDKPLTQALIKFGISMFGSEPMHLDIKPHGADEQWCEKYLAGRHWSEVTLAGFHSCSEYFFYLEPEGSYIQECTRFHLPGLFVARASCLDKGNEAYAFYDNHLLSMITANPGLWSKWTEAERRVLISMMMLPVGHTLRMGADEAVLTSLLDNIRTLDEE